MSRLPLPRQYRLRLGALAVAIMFATGSDSAVAASAHAEPYIVRFVEPGLLHYAGGVGTLTATRPQSLGARKLASGAPATRAYANWLAAEREAHVATIADTLDREIPVTHEYVAAFSGIAFAMTAEEAARVATLPGVAGVRVAGIESLQTFRGPRFIRAAPIWDGSATPTGVGSRGEGVIIGIIDSGTNSTHPAFANDASCGFSVVEPKLLSAVDCATSSNGVCNGPNPEANAENGHGVHVASTAGGNTLDAATSPAPFIPPPYTAMSGVAPCAQLRSYKVCETDSCDGAAITAAIDQAIADGVDVINFSISGGLDPWHDNDRQFLDAVAADIIVATAAGNGDVPIGAVNHLGPWVLSVAAVTHDENVSGYGRVSATAPGTPPAATQSIEIAPGSGLDPGAADDDAELRRDPANEMGCTPFANGYFADAFALVKRGDCNFEVKIDNAAAAGARAVFVTNNTSGQIYMQVGGATLPAYSLTQVDGEALSDFIAASDPAPVRIAFTPASKVADVLANFSLRGPTSGAFDSITKPDIAAPGVVIYAATDAASGQYAFMSGTSMASPHVAGAAALLRAVHPQWTVMEVKSALQTTARSKGLKPDVMTPSDADDVGSGRVVLDAAARAGLVLDETFDRFVAAEPTTDGAALRALNLPSLRAMDCSPECTFVRSLTNRLSSTGTWTATYIASDDTVSATIEPVEFTLAAGATQALTVTFRPPFGVVMTQSAFGRIVLTESEARSPEQHLDSVIRGVGSFDFVDVQAASATAHDSCSHDPGAENGIVEPGETVTLDVPLRARGHDFTGVHAALELPPPAGIEYVDAEALIGDLLLGDTAEATFVVRIATGFTCLDTFTLPLAVNTDQGTFRAAASIAVGTEHFDPLDVPMAVPDATPAGSVSEVVIPQHVALDQLAVDVTLAHGWIGDLTVTLRSPAGTEVVLLDRPGVPARGEFGCGNVAAQVRFTDAAPEDGESSCADGDGVAWPASTVRPTQPLAAFVGEDAAGVWTLTVRDAVSGVSGRLMNWSLAPQPAFDVVCSVCTETLFADGMEGDALD